MTTGSPKWSADGKRIVFYEVAVKDTYDARVAAGDASSRIVSIDVATGARTVHASTPGPALSPQFVGPDRIAYLARTARTATLTFTTGEKGPPEDMANPAWSPDGKQVVYHAGQLASMHHYSRMPGAKLLSRNPEFELVYGSGFPAVSPDGNHILWSSSRFGFKDEAPLTIFTPQPYVELFIMNADGSNQRPLTDNQYEDGTPAWQPRLLKTKVGR
jgi:Tol biopolymer transport system component